MSIKVNYDRNRSKKKLQSQLANLDKDSYSYVDDAEKLFGDHKFREQLIGELQAEPLNEQKLKNLIREERLRREYGEYLADAVSRFVVDNF